jgi:hypothetical protein
VKRSHLKTAVSRVRFLRAVRPGQAVPAIACAAVLCSSGLLIAQRSSTPATKKQQDFAVKTNGRTLLVTNLSNQKYQRIEIRLVLGMDFNRFVSPLKDIEPGKTITFNLTEVTDSHGERFNPAKYKPLVIIEGVRADGKKVVWGSGR